MDWNWFYTAIAQCSAAIVGFLGGFIITKILSSENEHNNIHILMDELSNKIQNQKRLLSLRYFEWYNRKRREKVRESQDYENVVKKGKGEVDYSCIDQFNYSPYDDLSKIIEEITNDWGSYQPQQNSFLNYDRIGVSELLTKELNEERELLDREYVNTLALNDEIKKTMKVIEKHNSSSGSYQFVIWSILVLFFIGIIYPLTFTPCDGEIVLCSLSDLPQTFFIELISIKGVILSVVSIIFCILMFFFLWKTTKMKINIQELELFKKHISVSSFSEYLNNRSKNEE